MLVMRVERVKIRRAYSTVPKNTIEVPAVEIEVIQNLQGETFQTERQDHVPRLSFHR